MADRDDTVPRFEAVLYPNPPLGRHGFLVLMLAVSVVSAALGAAFALAGAWPVSGFMGLDVLLLYVALRWSRRRSRRFEQIRLDATGLHVRRVGPDGTSTDWCFEPYWVRVAVEERRAGPGTVTLSSHGERLRIGDFLTREERHDLARALDAALRAYR